MKAFNFKFSEEEVIDYYTYMLSSLPSNRLKQIFIMLSVPLVLIFSFIFFKMKSMIILSIFIVVCVLWIFFVGPKIWHSYTSVNIGKKFLNKNNIKNYEKVDVKVDDSFMIVNGKKYEFNNQVKIVKTKLVTIFFFKEQTIAIPNRFLN